MGIKKEMPKLKEMPDVQGAVCLYFTVSTPCDIRDTTVKCLRSIDTGF